MKIQYLMWEVPWIGLLVFFLFSKLVGRDAIPVRNKFPYIVALNTYETPSGQRSALGCILEGYSERNESTTSTGACQWAARRHHLMGDLPSDFVSVNLICTNPPDASSVVQQMNSRVQSCGVRAIHPDQVYVRQPLFLGAPGRPSGSFSWEEENELNGTAHSRGLLAPIQTPQVTTKLGAEKLWDMGYTGNGIRVAVFDTGIAKDHPHFKKIGFRTNWTRQQTLDDRLGHGSFVAGVIAGQDPECLGFAPDAEINTFRVFTDDQVSYTSWFLDAFNYAIHTEMDVLNLSIGGPDYRDMPFVDKIHEVAANGIIVVSAIGNDGPLYGTLNNPADQMDVVGVGGIDYYDRMASFSSRGMTTWELPEGYGRMKPDIVGYGKGVSGSRISSNGKQVGCRSLSGTSVASPVIAGAVTLLASVIPENQRWSKLNPGSVKQALVEGATRIPEANMFEQGAGKINLLRSYEMLSTYVPRASVLPMELDLTECEYAWPYCTQPLYHTTLPQIVNTTVVNGMSVVGRIVEPPVWNPGSNGDLVDIRFTYADVLWPWGGWLALWLGVKETGANFDGVAEGTVSFTVQSPPQLGESQPQSSVVSLPVKVRIIPTPPKEKRILFDVFHNLRYPPGYLPRDNLDVKTDILDWNGDHPHTNYRDLYMQLKREGYHVELLGRSYLCFDGANYAVLMIVDPEEEFHPSEIAKIHDDVTQHGLGLVVFADWYNAKVLDKIRFFDENTRADWTAVTAGCNIPALNDLLAPFGLGFGDVVMKGSVHIDSASTQFLSGVGLFKAPAATFVSRQSLTDQGSPLLGGRMHSAPSPFAKDAVVLAMTQPALGTEAGRIAVYGDSNCIDMNHRKKDCPWLVNGMIRYVLDGVTPFTDLQLLNEPLDLDSLPERYKIDRFLHFSQVICPECSPSCLNCPDYFVPDGFTPALEYRRDVDYEGWRNHLGQMPTLTAAQYGGPRSDAPGNENAENELSEDVQEVPPPPPPTTPRGDGRNEIPRPSDGTVQLQVPPGGISEINGGYPPHPTVDPVGLNSEAYSLISWPLYVVGLSLIAIGLLWLRKRKKFPRVPPPRERKTLTV
eukprot:Rmarinus@m.1287